MEYAKVVEFAAELVEAMKGRGHHDYYIECTKGQKYVKYIIKSERNNHGSVLAFVELSSGDILKPGGFQAPQRDKDGLAVRGNIADPVDAKRILAEADPYGSFLYKR